MKIPDNRRLSGLFSGLSRLSRITVMLGLLLAVAAVFSACAGGGNGGSGRADVLKSVRVAFFPNITHAQALVGRAQGSFDKALGIPVEWKEFNAGSAEIEAFMAGEIDLGYIGPGPAINGFHKTQGALRVIAGASEAGAVLVARVDSKIKGVQDLAGKKVAVPQYGNTQDLLLRALLAENGLKDTAKGGTVEIAQVENPDVKTLFDQKSLDAALVPEPWGTRLEKEANARVILNEKQIWRGGKYPAGVVIVRTAFAQAHPEIVQKFVNEHVRLSEHIRAHHAEAVSAINAQVFDLTHKKLPPDVLDAAFRRVAIGTALDPEVFRAFADLSVTSGYYKELPDLTDLVNPAFLKKAGEQNPPET